MRERSGRDGSAHLIRMGGPAPSLTVRPRTTWGGDMATQPPAYDTLRAKELTSDDVQRLAQLLGLPIGPEDLAEITYRLGALIEALEKLTSLDLSREEPIPLFPSSSS